jgi:peroxiredoxin
VLQVGDRIPDAQVWLGPSEPMSLLQVLEDGPVLLVFYLFDWSSSCTNELELLRDRKAEFDAIGVRPIGISCDSPWTHIAWTHALDFNFPLISDWNREATRAFGIEHTFRGLEGVSRRCSYLVDADGTVRGSWLYDISELPDLDAVLGVARALPLSSASS